MANLSQKKRERMLAFLNTIKDEYKDDDIVLAALGEIETELTSKKYGLVWEEHEENVDVLMKDNIPVFTEVVDNEIAVLPENKYNFLLEGDNLHSLKLLEKTHFESIDVIYIDPPYNRGENDFIYNDNLVVKEDTFKHSKWLSFMDKRLKIAHRLLSPKGVIIINIDEHEAVQLVCLLNEIFGENNNIGEIIWNKMNPKGDALGISTMHETIYCFAKNKNEFLSDLNVCKRKKPNAEVMLNRASRLYKKLGKRQIPEDVAQAIKPFNYSSEVVKDFYVDYSLEMINKEFRNWLNNQPFSNGEKAYKFIDENGRIYRGVSMAWPNKKKAPDDYFNPLIHPVTKKECPVPARGWRNPPATMQRLLDEGLIIFGEDETKQPERKYYLDENMMENMPSIYENADSADNMLEKMGIQFEYPKPVSEAIYVCSYIQPNAEVFLDFFAGSATTAHAVLEMNKIDNGNRKIILCTNNENKICEEVTYERIKCVINGYGNIEGIPANFKYYRTDFVSKNSDDLSSELLNHVKEMVQLEHGIKLDDVQFKIILTDEEADELESKWDTYPKLKALYVSRDVLFTSEQNKLFSQVEVHVIPDHYFKFEMLEVGEAW